MAPSRPTDALRSLTRWLPVVACVLVALCGAIAPLHSSLAQSHLGRTLVALLDLDSETSVATWFSVAVLLGCGLAFWQGAFWLRAVGHRDARAWTLFAAICAGLSMEEIIGLHERLGNAVARALPLGSFSTFAWVIPGAIVVLVGALFAKRFLARQEAWFRRRLLLAGTLYFGGAVGCEALGGWIYVHFGKESLLFQLEVMLEEGLEMFGAIALLGTLLRALHDMAPPQPTTEDADASTVRPPAVGPATQSPRRRLRTAEPVDV